MGRPRKNKAVDDGAFPAKYTKVLGEEWMRGCDSMDIENLKRVVIESESSITEQETLKKNDLKLKEIKEQSKALSAGYKESIFYQTAKIKYAMKCLESRGAVVSPDDGPENNE